MSHQLTFADSEFSTKRRQTRKEIFLSRMEQILPWQNRGQFGYRKLLYVKLIFYHFWFFWKRNILDVKTVMRGH
ncbi:hypothetical protein EXX16_24340 [Escherichia coli]|nr:hypothetical protein EXX16_24340 [Escherichia coli]